MINYFLSYYVQKKEFFTHILLQTAYGVRVLLQKI